MRRRGGWYRTAAGVAEQRGQKERAELARGEAAKIEPKLHKLVLTVKAPAEGMLVTRNGVPVPNATLGSDVPIDPGDYTIEVTAHGKRSWKQPVHIASAPGIDRLEVPALEDAPAETKPSAPVGAAGPTLGGDYMTPPPPRDGSTQRVAAVIVGGAGIVAGVVAVVVEMIAVKEQDKSVANAAEATNIKPAPGSPSFKVDSDNQRSLQESATSHHNAAKSDEVIAIATGIGGAVLLGTGIALFLTAPSSRSSASLARPLLVPLVSRDSAGLGLVGTF